MNANPSEAVGATETSSSQQIPAELEQKLRTKAHIVIESDESGVSLDLSELWRYRELLYFLTWRDIKVRYKQTLMGVTWVILQPLLSMFLFTLFFNRFAGLKSGTMPYPLFAYAGLILWTFLSNAVINSTISLTSNTNLITKVYFPRMLMPAAAVAAGLVDLAVASAILVGLALYFGVHPGWSIWSLPIFIVLTILLALAVGLLISALTVKYRDLRHALPFLMQAWMFASPVIYPITIVPERWRWILIVNPFAPLVEGFRAGLVNAGMNWRSVTAAAAIITGLLAVSVYIFRRIEDTFADVI